MRYLILFVTIMLLISGCGLKRDNPLDPNGNSNIVIPGEVSGLSCSAFGSGSATRYVRMEWISNNAYNTDGYYVYRSLGYYNAYALIDTVMHVPNVATQSFIHSSANDASVSPGDYWYRISAFKRYNTGTLEGRYGTPAFVRINP